MKKEYSIFQELSLIDSINFFRVNIKTLIISILVGITLTFFYTKNFVPSFEARIFLAPSIVSGMPLENQNILAEKISLNSYYRPHVLLACNHNYKKINNIDNYNIASKIKIEGYKDNNMLKISAKGQNLNALTECLNFVRDEIYYNQTKIFNSKVAVIKQAIKEEYRIKKINPYIALKNEGDIRYLESDLIYPNTYMLEEFLPISYSKTTFSSKRLQVFIGTFAGLFLGIILIIFRNIMKFYISSNGY